jgi:hypothetical protein
MLARSLAEAELTAIATHDPAIIDAAIDVAVPYYESIGIGPWEDSRRSARDAGIDSATGARGRPTTA